MKNLFISMLMLLGMVAWCLPQASAQDDVSAPETQKAKKTRKKSSAGLSPVAKALAEAGYFTDTEARPKAKFYIFICSASWCGPCRALMPKVVEEYEKNMKKDKKVSMVLLGADRDEESARQYIEHYETDMPGVLKKAVRLENAPEMPGIPWYFILNAKGELVSAGAGSKILNWKEEIKKKPQRATPQRGKRKR